MLMPLFLGRTVGLVAPLRLTVLLLLEEVVLEAELLVAGELPEFASCLCCLLWHGWLLGLSSGDERTSWAASFGQLACMQL